MEKYYGTRHLRPENLNSAKGKLESQLKALKQIVSPPPQPTFQVISKQAKETVKRA